MMKAAIERGHEKTRIQLKERDDVMGEMVNTLKLAKNEIGKLKAEKERIVVELREDSKQKGEGYAKTISQLREEVASSREVIKQRTAQLQEATQSFGQAIKQVNELQALNKELRERLTRAQVLSGDLESRVHSMTKLVDEYKKDLKSMEDKYEEQVTILKVKEEILREKDREIDRLECEVTRLTEEKKREQAGRSKDTEKIEDKYTRLKGLFASLESKYESQCDLVNEMEEALDMKSQEFVGLQSKINQINIVKEQLALFEDRMIVLTDEKEKEKKIMIEKIKVMEAKVKEVEDRKKEMTEEKKALEDKLSNIKSSMRQKMEKVEEAMSGLVEDNRRKEETISQLKEEVCKVKTMAREKINQMASIFST